MSWYHVHVFLPSIQPRQLVFKQSEVLWVAVDTCPETHLSLSAYIRALDCETPESYKCHY